MTAVANPPTFPQIERPAWGSVRGNTPMNPDDVRGMFVPRKTLSRSNSASSISSSTSSNASNSTIATNGSASNGTPLSATSDVSQWSANGNGPLLRKRPQSKNGWPAGRSDIMSAEFQRPPVANRTEGMVPSHPQLQPSPVQPQMAGQQMMRPVAADQLPAGQTVLHLLSQNGTFERKAIAVPYHPDALRIGRQTNQKTVPTSTNGYFDSKVLSRQHAEIFAERNGKIYIRDVKSSNGTFVNGTRLSAENRESEPHELQTGDHLELGIDIVSEDQKTVVHHKVSAKVEHAGLLNSSNFVMEMNFGDLDPANNAMMMQNGMPVRGRAGNSMSMASNGRVITNLGAMNNPAPGIPAPRNFLSPVATDQILKRLSLEMRNARLQAQDLNRTNQFVSALLSKDDVKDLEKPEVHEQPKPAPILNGQSLSFRGDAKTRFSEPPAPPPQQPLPEKPDFPSLKRGMTDRPKSGPPTNTSPVRENMSQIKQLTDALNLAKRDIDNQTARMRELETMLLREREAREIAEQVAKRLEESSTLHMNGSATQFPETVEAPAPDVASDKPMSNQEEEVDPSEAQSFAPVLQHQLNNMDEKMVELQNQMEHWKQRCELAESERDADRKTLAEMVVQLRAEEAHRIAAQKERRSRSRGRQTETQGDGADEAHEAAGHLAKDTTTTSTKESTEVDLSDSDNPTLSRANTITPFDTRVRGSLQEQRLHAGLPYVSMVGVVLVGMGLMAYINGWQAPPPQVDR